VTRNAIPLALSLLAISACSKHGDHSTASMAPGAARGSSSGVTAIASDEAPTEAEEADGDYDRGIQAGRLTAGTFDDTLNGATFAAFMGTMNAWSSELAGFTGSMSVLRLVDDDGHPLPGIAVRVAGERGGTKRLVSGTDGRIVAFAGDQGLQFLLESDKSEAWRPLEAGGVTTIAMPQAQAPAIRKLDIALVIDATGSMGDELEYLKVELRSIADGVARQFPDVDQRFALVMYRDVGDAYVTRKFDFTDELERFERELGKQRADGGGDYPEAMHVALADAAELSWRSDAGTARIAFVVADAPPHDQDVSAALAATEQLRAQGVGIYPVAASGVAAEAEAVMRAAAAASGGQYVFLTDDSGVGNSHEEPHIPCYAVETLRDAMTRMVQTELAGAYVEPAAKRTVRAVGRSQQGVCETLKRAL
jgi:hypothetical protein